MSHQSGSIYKYSGTWYLKYRTFEGDSSSTKRVHRTVTLCAVNGERHHEQCTSRGEHRSKKSILPLRDALMKPVNDGAVKPADPKAAMLVTDFWETLYLPHISGKGGLKESTVWGYKQIWKQHLKPHFAGVTLRDYRTHHGSQLLTTLAKKLGRRTVTNTKNLMSADFTYAVNTGLIETNPCHDMKPLIRTIEPANTKAYDGNRAGDHQSVPRRADHTMHAVAAVLLRVAHRRSLRPEVGGLQPHSSIHPAGYRAQQGMHT